MEEANSNVKSLTRTQSGKIQVKKQELFTEIYQLNFENLESDNQINNEMKQIDKNSAIIL